jgi:RimJ/RimL family protein N-acetyltransferase
MTKLTVDNVASLRLWDQLGFTRVGVIPGAGRLRSGPNGQEEYVDAVIIHKSFV